MIKEFNQFNLENDIINKIINDIPKVIYDIWDISLDYQDDHGEMMFVAKYGEIRVPLKMVSEQLYPDISDYKDDFYFFCMAIDHLIKSGAIHWYDFKFINKSLRYRKNKILMSIENQINTSYPFVETKVRYFNGETFDDSDDEYFLDILIDRKWN